MTDTMMADTHSHVFLGDEHDANKQRTWWVIALCGAMMALEIGGGLAFGSIALESVREFSLRNLCDVAAS